MSKMNLKNVRSSRAEVPDRILIMGTEGVGKSTFAADSPDPIFLGAEDGLHHLDVQKFPEPETFADVLESVNVLRNEDHDYKGFVIDTLDWLEPLVWDSLCKQNEWANIESPGYGKGYNIATGEWRKLIAAIERLRAEKSMRVIFVAHTMIRNFANPVDEDYMRYECKLHKGAAALVKEWCDVVLFASHEEFVRENTQGKKIKKAASTGRRVMHTVRTAAWDAKTRYSLPEELDLSWEAYAEARAADVTAAPADLETEARGLLSELKTDNGKAEEIAAYIDNNKTDAVALAKLVNRLKTKVMEAA